MVRSPPRSRVHAVVARLADESAFRRQLARALATILANHPDLAAVNDNTPGPRAAGTPSRR